MKRLLLLFWFVLATLSTATAAPLKWSCNWPDAKSQTFSLDQGEIATFEPTFRINGGAPTNLPVVTVWYQTNGMDRAWWHTDGAVFHPTNDVGAATYRFFVDAAGDGGKLYRANGTLRMLPSPGFIPNTLTPPVATLDFDHIAVSNAPWPTAADYEAVSKTAMQASRSIDALAAAERRLAVDKAQAVKYLNVHPTNSFWLIDYDNIRLDYNPEMSTIYEDEMYIFWTGNHVAPNGINYNYQLFFSMTPDGLEEITSGWQMSVEDADGEWEDLTFGPSQSIYAEVLSNVSSLADIEPFGGNDIVLTRHWIGGDVARVVYDDSMTNFYNKTETEQKIVELAPAPGNYSVVSNKAMTALQSYTETDPTISSWAKAATKPSYSAAEVGAVPTSRTVNGKALSSNISLTYSDVGAASASDVTAIAATLNAENARFVSTNYNSATQIPSAYVEAKIDGSWLEIWNELTRWNWLTDTYLPANFYTKGQINSALDDKADRAWGFYDSHSGLYAPEGFTWVSSPKIAIASGLAYSRTVTAEGAVWVLESNGMVTETGGVVSNGFFRVSDDEGNALFEIVKGDKRIVGADANSVQTIAGFTPTKLQIGYGVVADAYPVLTITETLEDPDWYAEDDASCPANVTWSGTSGAYIATVQAKSASVSSLFVKAEYQVGGETYIKNVGPVSVEGGILCTDGVHKVRPVYNNGTITWEVMQ